MKTKNKLYLSLLVALVGALILDVIGLGVTGILLLGVGLVSAIIFAICIAAEEN